MMTSLGSSFPPRPTELLSAAGQVMQLPEESTTQLQNLVLVSSHQALCPRLFFFTKGCIYATSAGELHCQRYFLFRLGKALDAAGLLPWELFLARVAPAVLRLPSGWSMGFRTGRNPVGTPSGSLGQSLNQCSPSD